MFKYSDDGCNIDSIKLDDDCKQGYPTLEYCISLFKDVPLECLEKFPDIKKPYKK